MAAAPTPSRTTPRARVLVVDDDADMLRLLSLRLQAAGYDVVAVGSAEAALAQLDMARPQLVLSDVRLPGRDGLALFDEVRARHPSLPVILLTAHGTIPDAVEATPRARHPFVAVNCGAIPEALLESELFGHVKGAFTDAVSNHKGLFQAAEGGTLLLDEIGDMPPALQVKLLRVLQDRAVRPVGASQSIPIAVRLISATHRDLEAAMATAQFREDLYYRLNVVTLALPTLGDRREDIALLANHFLDKLARKYDKRLSGFAPEALK